jgi:hypothetical protein
MASFVLKLVAAPLLLAAASLVGRRWGSSVGGALAAIPIVSGSIAFFVTLDHGPGFGERTAAATLVGVCSLAWYALVYAHASRRFGWPVCLTLAYLTEAGASLAIIPLAGAPAFAVCGCAIAQLAIVFRLLPPVGPGPRQASPAWDIPVRMIVGTVLVLVLTWLARSLGPQLSGLLAAFPLVFSVLLVSTQRHEGPERARGLLRGFVAGLAATCLFLEIVADGLAPLGLGLTFVLAALCFVGCQAIVIGRMRNGQVSARLPLELAPAD